MKYLFLLPPSEGKNPGGELGKTQLSYIFKKPKKIALLASETDLKCTGERYQEGILLNDIAVSHKEIARVLPAINRYSGVMYNAIDYVGLDEVGKEFFDKKFLIFSGMYGVVKPVDKIENYKLPIGVKGLAKFWKDDITKHMKDLNPDYIVNLLPISYTKMIDFEKLNSSIIHINFLTKKEGKIVKVSHGVKKIKGEWIKKICASQELDFNNFGGKVVKMGKNIDIDITC